MKYFLTILFFQFTLVSCAQNELKFEVHAGDFERLNTPLFIEIEQFSEQELSEIALYEISENTEIEVASQLETGKSTKLWFTVQGTTHANTIRTFFIGQNKEGQKFQNIEIDSDEKALRFKLGEKYLLQYNNEEVMPPEGIDPLFKRSAFIHPVWSPDQQVLTRIQPFDHYHHYGIWNPWTRTKFQGRQIDFWNLKEGQGTVRFKSFISTTEGPVFGGFKALQEHIDFTSDQPELVALEEIWDIRVWNLQAEKKAYLIDFTSILSCATDSAVTLFAYRYGGGLGYRATEQWGKDNSQILTSEGKTRDKTDGTKARWCIISGETNGSGGNSGILFMSNPQNREHPEPMRMWPSSELKGKGNIFFEFCPIRHNKWILDPGKDHELKYRMLVFDDQLSAADAERYWSDFANPPEIRIVKK